MAAICYATNLTVRREGEHRPLFYAAGRMAMAEGPLTRLFWRVVDDL